MVSYDIIACYDLKLKSVFSEILQPPQNTTVFPNEAAEFKCKVSGGYTSWSVNGKPTNELSDDLRNSMGTSLYTTEDENPQHILIIIARYEYNESTVQCLIDGGFSGRSDIAFLLIQGNYWGHRHALFYIYMKQC